MKLAYADPPYLGCCRLYGHHHRQPFGCWDDISTHELLIKQLTGSFPDGWAMSTSSVALRDILPLCPPEIRVAAWVKPFCIFKKGVRPAYAWEPVLFTGGRNKNHRPPLKGGEQTTPKDYISAPVTLRRGLTGVKPETVCRWVLDLLGYVDGDELVDLFPGTGTMGHVVAQQVMM